MTFTVLIPARYGSTRFPGKPLAVIAGRTMIERVYAAAAASGARRVAVATDDERIATACRGFGAEVVMTAPDHVSGTDRLAEAATRLRLKDEEIVVNLQGDEPLLPPTLLAEAASSLDGEGAARMGTLATPVMDVAEVFEPNAVKVVCDRAGYALYFSRAPIPWERDGYAGAPRAPAEGTLRHLGIYAYRVGFLRIYPELEVSPLERLESLEQLRVLWNGYRIRVARASTLPGPGVDTPEDIGRVERALSRQ
ncbi:3-deoxy-manno-octulosonate cytidylyltransferase [Ectothiorhodospiraceae bacterium WFHF3C12]|nr:3-deoxy-manno-octulosonate cytidylyltransferase [Ectothiorhodospiraceae bacterium WFHF3C12]